MPHLASRRRPLIGRGARRLLPAFSLDGLRPCQNAESHQESHPGGFLSRFKALTRLRLRALGLAMLPIFGHGDDISSLTSIFPAIMIKPPVAHGLIKMETGRCRTWPADGAP